MPSQTTIRICDPFGGFLVETAEFLEAGNNPGLRYVLSCGQVGAMTVTLPPEYNPMLLKDGRIHIMRSVNGGPAQREVGSCYLIRRWDYADNYTTVTAVHANDIMRRRCSLWAAGTAQSEQDALNTQDAMVNVWDANFGTQADTYGRAFDTTAIASNAVQANISAFVSQQPSAGLGPAVAIYYPWQNILEVLTNLSNNSLQNGTFLISEIVAPTEATLEWRMFAGQRGVDRRFSAGNGLLFSSVRGNLENAILTVDATEEITFTEAGGAQRDVVDTPLSGLSNRTAIDTVRVAESPFGRIEQFVDSGSSTDLTMIKADADAVLRAGRPHIMAVADITETDQCIRGVHFDYGDYVTVEIQGIQYDMRLNLMEVTINASGDRTVARFEYNA
jgi:Siphovirus ReqiPepy6 Gp37-like protein